MKKLISFLFNRVEIPNWWALFLIFLALTNIFFIFYYLSLINLL